MHKSSDIAQCFLDKASAAGKTLTPMQLLKLVYIAHGWTLGLLRRPLISDQVEAWQYGPVIRNLYNHVRKFRDQPVSGHLGDSKCDLDEQEKEIVVGVFEAYSDLSGPALSNLTHAVGSPWHQVYRAGQFGVHLPNDIIEDYYAGLVAQGDAA